MATALSTDIKPDHVMDSNAIDSEKLMDYSYGLVIGGGIGDSVGSYLEFTSGNSTSEVIDCAMTMPGGGTWGSRVKPGQVTDDTELAISLCRGIVDIIKHQNADKTTDKSVTNTIKNFITSNIIKHKNNDDGNITHHIYDSYYVAEEYGNWYDSNPFDIGGCTNCTIGEAPSVPKMKRAAFDYDAMMAAHYKGSGNLANGSLMRCMPLIVYGYKLNHDELYNLMTEDSSLTHANSVVFVANTAYAIAAQYLLQTDAVVEEKKTDDDVEQCNRNKLAFMQSEHWLNGQRQNQKENKAFQEVYEWLMDCKQDDISKLHPATKHIGFVKIAFQRALYHLWNGTEFETAIKMTISEGGDTDTNGCIVGGLSGALWGFHKIPKKFKDKIMDCAPAKPSRDKIFQAKMYINRKYIETIIENAPNTVQVKAYKMTASKI